MQQQPIQLSEEFAKIIMEILIVHCDPDGKQDEKHEVVKNWLRDELSKLKHERIHEAWTILMKHGLQGVSLLPLGIEGRKEIEECRNRIINVLGSKME